MTTFSRRQVLGAAALGTSLAACAAPVTDASAFQATPDVPEETRTLDQLHADAVAEGGHLVVYAGGDTATEQDATRQAFLSRFPGLSLTVVVDYSKVHDVRVDIQLATGTLVPDVVQLNSLHDFPSWQEEGLLLPYKPTGFSAVHDAFKEPGGAWLATAVVALSFLYDGGSTGPAAPVSPRDLLDPRWKGRIASSYPQDDDAVLFLYRQYVHEYGWGWAAGLAAQDVQFARGAQAAVAAVDARQKVVGIGGTGTPIPAPDSPIRWVAADDTPFLAWGRRSAILAGAAHPAAAKLYLNWQLSPEVQQAASTGWPVRTDVAPAGGLKPIWDYPNAHIEQFDQFMADRAEVERWRQSVTLYLGEVQGAPNPGRLGLHPGRPVT